MATLWDAIDPEDVVDLWVNLGGVRPFLPAEELLTDVDVTVPVEVNLVTSDIDTLDTSRKVRIRVGPCQTGTHEIHYHVTTDTAQEFDFDVPLTVKERVKT